MTDPDTDSRAKCGCASPDPYRPAGLMLGLRHAAWIFVGSLAWSGTGSSATAETVLGRNLISNPGAEEAADRWAKDWTPGGVLESAVYGRIPGEWSWRYIGAPRGGERYFRLMVPVGERTASVSQWVSVAADSAAIDSGRVRSSLLGFFGRRIGDRVTITLAARMLDRAGKTLHEGKAGNPCPKEIRPLDGAILSASGLSGPVPRGTRRIVLTLAASIPDSSRCNACPVTGLADQLSFVLQREGVRMESSGPLAADHWYRAGPRPSWAPKPDTFWVDPFEQRARASYGSFETACDAVESIVGRAFGSIADRARWERRPLPIRYADGLVIQEVDDPPYSPGNAFLSEQRPDSVEVPTLLMTLRLPQGTSVADSAFWGAFGRAGWVHSNVYSADGPNGSSFDFVCREAICIVDMRWIDEPGANSTHVPDGAEVIEVRCVPRPGMSPSRPWRP